MTTGTRSTAPSGPDREAHVPPQVVATGTATGLLLMAVFTLAWVGNTFAGFPAAVAWTLTAAAAAAAGCFVAQAVRLLAARHRFPADLSAQDQARRRRTGQAFGLVFGAEGAAIGAAAAVLGSTGHDAFVVPVIALVVGLHFYPMARIFERRIDTYLATWTCLVALAGILATATAALPAPRVQALVGVGTALATTAYGAYMLRLGSGLLRRAR